jgi:hypothetical protein
MTPFRHIASALGALALIVVTANAQTRPTEGAFAAVRLHLDIPRTSKPHDVPAVMWLKALPGTVAIPFSPHGQYTLLQKNRMFLPHLQVIPVSGVVRFPNADPFFHNVFSLFDGKRFDLGLYEAGSSKEVTFSREGVSYIFCNIHPEMSAVILSLSTPLFAVADVRQDLRIRNIPPGDYEINLWVEGVPQSSVASFHRQVHLASGELDLGSITIDSSGLSTAHLNKFGKPYEQETKRRY